MNRYIAKAIRMCTLLLLMTTFWTTHSYGINADQLFVWVSRQMNVEHIYNMPKVYYVNKQQLQSVFQDFSQKSMQQWRLDHGEDQADIIMQSYTSRVMGLFNPATEAIYVGSHLLPCRQKAVLAHEITHYFQHLINGPIDAKGFGAEDLRMFREMEAYQIEIRFKTIFCDPSGYPERLLSYLYYP